MKKITYTYPKSSFLNIEKDLGIIIEKILQNERLKKLLYYTGRDALLKDKLTEEQQFELLGNNIKLVPKVYIDKDMLVYMIITFNDFVPNKTNPEFRDNTVQFDIICHFDQWLLNDMQLRPYKIAAEIDTMFNGAKITGIGKFEFKEGVQTAISGEEYAGVSLTYKAIHGEDDKINAPEVPSNSDLAENFNAIFNPKREIVLIEEADEEEDDEE